LIESTGRAPRQRALTRLRQQGATPEAIEQLLRESSIPLVESTACTFLWRGDADWVGVEHRVMGWPVPLALRRMPRTDLWHATAELPKGSRVEYRLLVRYGDNTGSVLDPLNPRRAVGPTSEMSVVEGEGYTTPDWALHDPAAVAGELSEVRVPSRALRRDVRLTIYLPARMRRDNRLPLLVVHDGGDFLKYSGLATVFDNLMHRRLMADCIVVLDHPDQRLREYAANAAHGRFLTGELVPMLERRLPLRGVPSGRVLAGASFGAVAALSAAVRAPGFYSGLLLESASLRYTVVGRDLAAGAVFEPVVRFVNELRAKPRVVTERIFQTFGAYEPLAEPNRAMTEVLQRLAGEVRVVEGLDGHNWTNWRDRLLDGLAWLFPGEARLIYP
jgi:enterochelin esterase-like enzyme